MQEGGKGNYPGNGSGEYVRRGMSRGGGMSYNHFSAVPSSSSEDGR